MFTGDLIEDRIADGWACCAFTGGWDVGVETDGGAWVATGFDGCGCAEDDGGGFPAGRALGCAVDSALVAVVPTLLRLLSHLTNAIRWLMQRAMTSTSSGNANPVLT